MITPKRLYFGLIVLIGLLIIGLFAGSLGINSMLSKRSADLVSLRAKSQALDQEHVSLATAKKSINKYSDLEKIAQSIVPEDKDQAQAVREIVNIATANKISLASITFPASTLGNTTAGPATTTTTPTAVNPKSPAATLSQLVPVPNISGVYQLSIAISGDSTHPVPYNSLINFLSNLEHNRRTAQISSLTIAPDSSNRSLLTFTLNLNEYIKP